MKNLRLVAFVVAVMILAPLSWNTAKHGSPIVPAWSQIPWQRICPVLEFLDRFILEPQCESICDLEKKVKVLNRLVSLQDSLVRGWCPGTRTYDDLCGGIFDFETTYIDITPAESEIPADGTVDLTATFQGTECRDGGKITGEINWASFDRDIAVVESTGPLSATVTGKSEGLTWIHAVSVDIPEIVGSAKVAVNCDPEDASIDVTPTSSEIEIGETLQLTATLVDAPDCLAADFEWVQPTPGVVSLDQNGLVTGIAEGERTIFVGLKNHPSIMAGAHVIVEDKSCGEIEEGYVRLDPYHESTQVTCLPSGVGDTCQLSATVMVYDPVLDEYVPSDCHQKDIEWCIYYGMWDPVCPYFDIDQTGLVTSIGPVSDPWVSDRCLYDAYVRDQPWVKSFGAFQMEGPESAEPCTNPCTDRYELGLAECIARRDCVETYRPGSVYRCGNWPQ